jgi:hypothetical protein
MAAYDYQRAPTNISRDEHIYIFSEPVLHLATRILIAWILVAILPVPIVIMQAISSNLPRVLCTFFAMLFLLVGISCFSNARTAEIFIAAATYVRSLRSDFLWENLLTRRALGMQPFWLYFWPVEHPWYDMISRHVDRPIWKKKKLRVFGM